MAPPGNIDGNSSDSTISALTDLPMFLGYMSSFFLQGIMVVQVFIYYVSFRNDARYIKVAVWTLLFVEILSTVFATTAALVGLVKDGFLMNSASLWPFEALAPLCGLVTLIVHMFYAWRIHVLGGHIVVVLAILVLTCAQCGSVIWAGFKSVLGVGISADLPPSSLAVNVLWLATSALADVIVAVSLVILLRQATLQLRRSRTKSRVEKVMTVAVETGAITALGALIELAFFLAFRNSFIHFIMFYMLPKLYANCMLATLNSRLAVPGRMFRESTIEWATHAPNGEIFFRTFPSDSEHPIIPEPVSPKSHPVLDIEKREDRAEKGFSFLTVERDITDDCSFQVEKFWGSYTSPRCSPSNSISR